MSYETLFLHLGQSALFGVVQGVTEFLPISSSGHLLLLHDIIPFRVVDEQVFDVALHTGTLIAVLIAFWPDLRRFWAVFKHPNDSSSDRQLLRLLVVATIPAILVGAAFEKFFATSARSHFIVAISLIVGGVALWWADRQAQSKKNTSQLRWSDALLIGVGQAIALIPGVSRSGASMTMGRIVGLDRASAVRFAFLMAIPVITGATLFTLPDLFKSSLSTEDWMSVLTGVGTAALAGFFSIQLLLRYVLTKSFAVFTLYRCLVGVVVLLNFWMG